jgi:methylmalonyl-CoA mutase
VNWARQKQKILSRDPILIEELTGLVEEAVLKEFDRLTERGGVLGAMERMYQRNKIQEESMVYESRKHSGELPFVGVNTFLQKDGSKTIIPNEIIRSTAEEKQWQISNLNDLKNKRRKIGGCPGGTQTDCRSKRKSICLPDGNCQILQPW